MYKTIKGIYRKGIILPLELVDLNQDEVEVIITFLKEGEKAEVEHLSSSDRLLYTIGERALEGKYTNTSERHDYYLYSHNKKIE